MTAREHACSSCEGRGHTRAADGRGYFTDGGVWIHGIDRCPVCLGSGRISDVIPARDAMVDARTLEQFILGAFLESMLAEILSEACEAFLAFVDESDADSMRYATRRAARAAFRAVPALRGE